MWSRNPVSEENGRVDVNAYDFSAIMEKFFQLEFGVSQSEFK